MKRVNFGLAKEFDSGDNSCCAINRYGRAVEVHKSENLNTLWCNHGTLKLMNITWEGNKKYDTGVYPDVDINDSDVIVEVHQSESGGNIWYHVGKHNGNCIDWGESHKYDSGAIPSVSVNNSNVCVEVHSSEMRRQLWYHVGIVNPQDKTIQWGASYNYDSGTMPDVSVNNNNMVVEVHESEYKDVLWYHVGCMNPETKEISFGASIQIGEGSYPSVALMDDNQLLLTYYKGRNVYYLSGQLLPNEKRIKFNTLDQFDNRNFIEEGDIPHISAARNGLLVLLTYHVLGGFRLAYSTSLNIDRTYWMNDNYDKLKGCNMKQITLAGTHNAGTYRASEVYSPEIDERLKKIPYPILRDYSMDQSNNIYSQLRNGVRILDLRVWKDGNEFYAYHSIRCAAYNNILRDISRYLEEAKLEGKREFIILQITHFEKFDVAMHREFLLMLENFFQEFLWKGDITTLQDLKYGDVVKDKPIVIILYEVNSNVVTLPSGIHYYKRAKIIDSYANSDSYDTMKSDQIAKVDINTTINNFFYLSWTLTPQASFATFWDSNIRNMAARANHELISVMSNELYAKKVNVIWTDYYEDARATDCAIIRNI